MHPFIKVLAHQVLAMLAFMVITIVGVVHAEQAGPPRNVAAYMVASPLYMFVPFPVFGYAYFSAVAAGALKAGSALASQLYFQALLFLVFVTNTLGVMVGAACWVPLLTGMYAGKAYDLTEVLVLDIVQTIGWVGALALLSHRTTGCFKVSVGFLPLMSMYALPSVGFMLSVVITAGMFNLGFIWAALGFVGSYLVLVRWIEPKLRTVRP